VCAVSQLQIVAKEIGASFVCRSRSSQIVRAQLRVTEEEMPIHAQDLEQPVQKQPVLLAYKVVLPKVEPAIRFKIQESLDRLHILNFRVVKLVLELEIVQYRRGTDETEEDHAEDADVPKREPVPYFGVPR